MALASNREEFQKTVKMKWHNIRNGEYNCSHLKNFRTSLKKSYLYNEDGIGKRVKEKIWFWI